MVDTLTKYERKGNNAHITRNGKTLVIPLSNFGSGSVELDGAPIPAARVWEIMAHAFADKIPMPLDALLDEAERAAVYRQIPNGQIVWTKTPRPGDKHMSGNVYARLETQRVRYLVQKFGIKIAKADEHIDEEILKEIHEVALTFGFHPVGFADEHVYYTKDPQAVFDAFGSTDWQRLAIYLRRPSATYTEVQL